MATPPNQPEPGEVSSETIEFELTQLCASPTFQQSARLKRFVRYAVEMSQRGDTERLKELVIGTAVFDRPLGYNPKEDAIVRVEAHRLRQKLDQYYANEGKAAKVRFLLPKGQYGIRIERNANAEGATEPLAAGPETETLQVRTSISTRKALILFSLAISLGAGGWYTLSRLSSRSIAIPAIQWNRLTLDNGLATDPVLFPDNKSAIYSADRGSGATMALWRQDLDGSEPVRLTQEPFDATKPDLSPDGRWIVYHSRDSRAPGIYRRPVSGGASKLLLPGGLRPRYSPDGKWILYTLRNEQEWQPGRIGIVPAEGGAPIELASDFADAHFGVFSDDSRRILFCGTRVSNVPEQEHDWWVVTLPEWSQAGAESAHKTLAFNGLQRHVTPGQSKVPPNEFLEQPAEWLSNFIYFSSPIGNPLSSTVHLWRLKVDNALKYQGTPVPEQLTFGATADLRARVRRLNTTQNRIIAASGSTSIDIWRLPLQSDREGRQVGGVPTRITSQTDAELFPTASPDGNWLAYIADRQSPRQLFLRNLRNRDERIVAPAAFSQDFPVMSPDSKRVAFRQYEQPAVPILIAETDSKRVTRVCEDCGAPTSWSPDGNYLLYEPGATIAYVGRYNLRTRQPEVLLRHPEYSLRGARYSPNGRWIAMYAETSREGRRVFIARSDRETTPGEWIAVTAENEVAMLPAWCDDSSQLIYLSDSGGQRTIAGQRVDVQTARPVGAAFTVKRFDSPRRSLLRLTRSRVAAVGLSVRATDLYFSLDEQLAEIFWADIPAQ